ncbi:MAG: hypothetical protein ACLFU5_00330 [Thermoplasmata archaeon]
MQRGFKIIAVVVITVLIIFTSLYALMWDMKRRSYSSQYEYQLDIRSDSEITNVTVFVPLPEELSEENISAPEGWDVEFHDEMTLNGIEHENILSVEVDEISRYAYRSVSISMEKEEDIDTQDPWDKEPMLGPKNNLIEIDCDYPGASESEVECYRYSGVIYASFEAEENTTTDISLEIYGSNTWWVGGWSGNEYHDRLWVHIEGNGTGIYEGSGEVRTGVGNY